MTDTPSSPPVPSFHDGELTSIAVGEKSAILGLQNIDGNSYELKLSGVQLFRANDFLEGNIILHLEVITGRISTWTDVDARLAELFPSPHMSVAPKYHQAHAAWMVETAARIANGEAVLVSVEPSYGCDLVALCSGAHLIAVVKE